MQLVSREVLFDVMAHRRPVKFKPLDGTSIDEAERPATMFKSFMSSANELLDRASGDINTFHIKMFSYMKENEDIIKYVNEGSSRVVYAMADGTVLKVAKIKAGIAQNKQEAKICMNPDQKYEIFPDFYDADTQRWVALNCEMCTPARQADFAEIFKIQPEGVADTIEWIIKHKIQDWDMFKAYEHFMFIGSGVYAKFIQKIIQDKSRAFSAIRSLIDFYRTHGLDELLLGDVEALVNWGLTMRDNEKVLVILDAGFNKAVQDEYYSA